MEKQPVLVEILKAEDPSLWYHGQEGHTYNYFISNASINSHLVFIEQTQKIHAISQSHSRLVVMTEDGPIPYIPSKNVDEG